MEKGVLKKDGQGRFCFSASSIDARELAADPSLELSYVVAPPRMKLYEKISAKIFSIYLRHVSADDIHVYSIDECFIDVTGYLKVRGRTPREFTQDLIREVLSETGITATAGIGTNLYLAKIALDITAKHARDHIGYLDEETYRRTLWDHRPITDFWMVAGGTARRLERYGVYDMRGVTQMDTSLAYKIFGKNAELLIDHAWGRESCLISDIKGYKSKTKSVSFSQILPRDYSYKEARTVIHEMALNGAAELMKRKVITNKVAIFVGYTHDERPPTKGGTKLDVTTNLASFLVEATLALYEKTTDPTTPIRRLGIAFENVCDEGCEGYNLFTDFAAVEKERTLQHTILGINEKFGKNAVLTGVNYMPEGTQRERNGFIGGHRAGYDDKSRKG
jgi:DNA polymerase V